MSKYPLKNQEDKLVAMRNKQTDLRISDDLYPIFSNLLVKTKCIKSPEPFPVTGNWKPVSRPQITLVCVDLLCLIRSLTCQQNDQPSTLFYQIQDQAYSLGACEIRLSESAELGDGSFSSISGDIVFVFLGEEGAKKMMEWLSQAENRALIGCEPRYFLQDFENSMQYEKELCRLETSKA
jgi:hypothetical protein